MNHRLLPLLVLFATGCGASEEPPPEPHPPSAPQLDPVGSPTRENPVRLAGRGASGATVSVRGGANPVAQAAVGAGGAFSVEVALRSEVENTLLVSQSLGGVEGPAVTIVILHDGTPPDSPRVDPPVTPTRRTRAHLSGSAEASAVVLISGGSQPITSEADAGGRFEADVDLNTQVAALTQNDLTIIARDAAGNESDPATLTIVHNPGLPLEAPLLDALPAYTSSATLTARGTTEPGASIAAAGGAEPSETIAGGDGRFSLSLALHPNRANNLTLVAHFPTTGVSSPAATAVVIHDDIAPDAPSVEPVSSPTGATEVRLAGVTEAGAVIQISGGASPVEGAASADGSFSIRVPLTADAVNDLHAAAIDAAGNRSSEVVLSIEQDSSLEAPIEVDPVASPTSANPIQISGRARALVEVEILGGSAPVTTMSAADGAFSASVTLTPNARNTLRARRTGSTTETTLTVVHDSLRPGAPSLDAIPSPTNQTTLAVHGGTEPGARVAVSGGEQPSSATADTAGRFTVMVVIAADTTTTLNVFATDRAGNASDPAVAMVTHSSTVPDAPVLDEPSPAPTNQPTHLVTGRVSMPAPDVTVTIRGGAAVASGDTDPVTGAFSIEVSLSPNATNELSVTSLGGSIESPPAIASILHDDQPPAAPDGAHISLGSPSLAGCVGRVETISVTGGAGAVEARARVRVLNVTEGTLQSTVSADVNGGFTTTLRACAGDILRFTARDAATNESEATELTVTR